ncbi:TraY domain-containing protein [Salmonella enterica]
MVKDAGPKTISVDLSGATVQRLHKAMAKSGRKARHEVMIRLAHSLKHIPEIKEVYWEILQEDKQK